MTTIATNYPFVGSIDTKQGGRSENQDNAGFVDTPLGLLLVVCDGMGGGPGGRTASLMAVDTILSVLSDVSEHTPREDALKFAIEKANDIIYSKAKETPELRGMGTTVAAILINEDSAVIAHAGDTRIYQLRKGTIIFRSSDHSVVANLVRQKKITEEEARNHPQSNIVTRALGIRPNMDIEFDEVAFLRGDRFVLCTDGIWGMMPQRDLVLALSRVMGICELTSAITDEIDRIGFANGGGHDNLTLAVVDTSFDSIIKKIKKKSHVVSPNDIQEDTTKPNSTKKNLSLIIIGFFVSIFALALYFILSTRESKESRSQLQLKGITTTTISSEKAVAKGSDSMTMDPTIPVEQVSPQPKRTIDNPFQDPTLKNEKKQEISRQINNVVKELDSLKKMNEKSRGKTEKRKRKFVNEVINPEVNQMKNKVVDEKKKDIKEILRLLNDRKTVSSDRHGRTTLDSKNHIEIIKKKVRGLQI